MTPEVYPHANLGDAQQDISRSSEQVSAEEVHIPLCTIVASEVEGQHSQTPADPQIIP